MAEEGRHSPDSPGMMSKYAEGGHHGTPAPAVTPLTPGTLRSPVTLSCQRQLCLASPVPTSLPGLASNRLSEGYTNAPNLALRRKQAGLSTLKLKSGGRIWGPCRSCRLLAVGGARTFSDKVSSGSEASLLPPPQSQWAKLSVHCAGRLHIPFSPARSPPILGEPPEA